MARRAPLGPARAGSFIFKGSEDFTVAPFFIKYCNEMGYIDRSSIEGRHYGILRANLGKPRHSFVCALGSSGLELSEEMVVRGLASPLARSSQEFFDRSQISLSRSNNGDKLMNSKRVYAVVALTVVLCLSMMFFVDLVAAQDSESKSAKKSDQSTASKQGVKQSLETPTKAVKRGADGRIIEDEEDSGRPSKLQMGIGFGSVFVMIAVVKFL